MLFDINAESILLRMLTREGIKKVAVRFPTDDEYVTWRRKKKVIQKDLGRRNYEMQPSKPEACDLALINTIRLDKDGPLLSEADAVALINQLIDCEVSKNPEIDDAGCVVSMTACKKIETTHTLRLPSSKEWMDHRGASVINGAYGYQEIRLNPNSAGDLYDKLIVKADGYVSAVPIAHKCEVINALVQEIQVALEDSPESDEDQD